MQYRKCKQCTLTKPIEQYRLYPNRKKVGPRYLQCLTCESLNNAYKDAKRKDNTKKIGEIELIYTRLKELGGVVPGAGRNNGNRLDFSGFIETILVAKGEDLLCEPTSYHDFTIEDWLSRDLSTHNAEEIANFVSTTLKDRICPVLHIDENTYEAVRDTTNYDSYKLVMERVWALEY